MNRRGVLSSQSCCTLGTLVPLVCTLLLVSCLPPAFRDLQLKSQHWSVSHGGDKYPTLLKSLTVSHRDTAGGGWRFPKCQCPSCPPCWAQ